MKRAGLFLIAFSMRAALAQTATPAAPMFAPSSPYSAIAGAYPRAIAAGDFNGDQISDLAIINPYSETLTIVLGTPTGALVSPSQTAKTASAPPALFQIPLNYAPTAIAAGFFQTNSSANFLAGSPGPVDLLVAGPSSVTLWAGDGAGHFTSFSTTAVPPPMNGSTPQISAITVSDFDGDGSLDFAVADAANNAVSVFFGDGKGAFSQKLGLTMPILVGNHPVSLAPGYFDGFPGIAVANQLDGSITLISLFPQFDSNNMPSGLSALTYPPFPVLPGLINPPFPYPTSIAVADVNNDGFPDLMVANDGMNSVSILLGDGYGGFTYAPGSPVAVGASPMSIATADFNGDGNADFAVAAYSSGSVWVLLGSGSGGFTAAPGSPYPAGESAVSVAVGDFNGASRASLAATSEIDNTVTVLLNNATPPLTVVSGGSFTAPVSPGSLIAVLGSSLASATLTSVAANSTPSSYVLGGISASITYSNSQQDQLKLVQVGASQVLAVIPASSSTPPTSGAVNPVPGLAAVTLNTSSKSQTAQIEIAPIAPALIAANGNGKGLASGTFSGGTVLASIALSGPPCQFTTPYSCATSTPPACSATSPCVAQALDFSMGGMLTLNATGLNAQTTGLVVSVGNKSAVATAVTAQPNAPGVYTVTAAFASPPQQRGLVPVTLSFPNSSSTTKPILVSNVVYILIQ